MRVAETAMEGQLHAGDGGRSRAAQSNTGNLRTREPGAWSQS